MILKYEDLYYLVNRYVLWNFGYPSANPIEDVIAAVILSFISMGLKKYLKL